MSQLIEDEDLVVSREEEEVWNDDTDPLDAIRKLRNEMSDSESDVDEQKDPEDELDEEEVATSDEEDELEQPEDTKDSDESDEAEVETDESEEVNDDQTDDDTADETKDTEDVVATYKVKANGQEFDFSLDELMKLAPKAMDYTRKMQQIAPWRKTLSALEEQNVSADDVNFMIDALKGDKDAIAALLKRTGVDTHDLDTDEESNYTPTSYGKDPARLAVDEVIQEIGHDEEYKITQSVVNNQWDAASQEKLFAEPDMIRGLHNDIKQGVFDKVAPLAMKMKALDGGKLSDIEYYMQAGNQYFTQLQQEEAKNTEKAKEVAQENEREAKLKAQAKKRKAASPTSRSAGAGKVVDYLDDNDEKFDEWYKNLMNSQ